MSAPAFIECCATCRFWDGKSQAEPYPHCDGWCRRHAPQGPVIKPAQAGWQLFPPMNSNQWCGDYEEVPALRERLAIAAAEPAQGRAA